MVARRRVRRPAVDELAAAQAAFAGITETVSDAEMRQFWGEHWRQELDETVEEYKQTARGTASLDAAAFLALLDS